MDSFADELVIPSPPSQFFVLNKQLRTKVLLDKTCKQMVEKEARRRQKLIGDREFILALGHYFRQIAEERDYTVIEHEE